VVVTPPNFGPGLYGVVTMYDVIYDLFVRKGWIEPPHRLTFWDHICPLFERLVNSQWVNQGAYFLFGPGSPGDLTDPAILRKLSNPGAAGRAERQRIFRWFRQPPPPWDAAGERALLPPPQPSHLPPFYGDGFGEYQHVAIDELALTQTLYGWLRNWANGDFVPGQRRRPPRRLSDLPLAAQPDALDRAAGGLSGGTVPSRHRDDLAHARAADVATARRRPWSAVPLAHLAPRRVAT